MTISEIIAQIMAFMGLGSNIISVQCKRRRLILAFQVLGNILYGLQYVFLRAWPGFTISIISAIECVVVYYYANYASSCNKEVENARKAGRPLSEDEMAQLCTDEKKFNGKMPVLVFVLMLVAITVMGFLSYRTPMDLLPIVVTAIYTWAIWQPDTKKFRLAAVTFPICWFIYNMYVGAWVSMCTSVVEFISAIAAIVRIDVVKYNHNHGGQEHN